MVPLYIFLYCSLYVSKNQSLTPNNILFSEKLNLFELLTRTSFALSPTSHSLAPDCGSELKVWQKGNKKTKKEPENRLFLN